EFRFAKSLPISGSALRAQRQHNARPRELPPHLSKTRLPKGVVVICLLNQLIELANKGVGQWLRDFQVRCDLQIVRHYVPTSSRKPSSESDRRSFCQGYSSVCPPIAAAVDHDHRSLH